MGLAQASRTDTKQTADDGPGMKGIFQPQGSNKLKKSCSTQRYLLGAKLASLLGTPLRSLVTSSQVTGALRSALIGQGRGLRPSARQTVKDGSSLQLVQSLLNNTVSKRRYDPKKQ